MFICTYNDNTAKELESKLKLVQKVRNYNKTLYVFEFNKNIYNIIIIQIRKYLYPINYISNLIIRREVR